MAGKQYTSAKLLYNADGDPIPQFLDVSDTTDSPQGTFKPITSKSDVSVTNFPTTQNVQLTGSNVVEVLNEQITTKLFDVKQIRDTSRHISALSNVIGENKKIVVMYNKHDAEVKVSIVGRVVSDVGLTKNIIPQTALSAGAFKVFDSLDYPILEEPYAEYYADATATTAPTSGDLDVWVVYKK